MIIKRAILSIIAGFLFCASIAYADMIDGPPMAPVYLHKNNLIDKLGVNPNLLWWNGSFSSCKRGTSFHADLSAYPSPGVLTPNFAGYTCDNTVGGPGDGGINTMTQYELTTAERISFPHATSPPRYAYRMVWTKKPIRGGLATNYPNSASYIEHQGGNLFQYAGRVVTMSMRIKSANGLPQPYFCYFEMEPGADTVKLTNTIVGDSAGVDYTYANNNVIYYRSAKRVAKANGEWDTCSITALADDLKNVALVNGGGITIGLAMNYNEILDNTDLITTAVKMDIGPRMLDWVEPTKNTIAALSGFQTDILGDGISCQVKTATSLYCALQYHSMMNPNPPALFLLQPNPVFMIDGNTVTGSGSTFTAYSQSVLGATVIITGFTGLTAGKSAIYAGGYPLFVVQSP